MEPAGDEAPARRPAGVLHHAGRCLGILRILAEERRRREITPTLATLDTLLARHADTDDERFAQLRMEQMHALIAQLTGWYDDVKGLDNTHLSRLLSLGATVMKLLGKRDRGAGRGKPVEEQGHEHPDIRPRGRLLGPTAEAGQRAVA